MIFNQHVDDRKVRSFALSATFLEEFCGRQPEWGPVGYFTFKRCVGVETPVLCGDLRWRAAGNLKVGQTIIGFDPKPISKGKQRHLRWGTVLHNAVEEAETFKIELEDGTILYATPDHEWLVKFSVGSRVYWRETQHLGQTKKGGDVFLLRPFGPVWDTDDSYGGGFLSAAYDGEGCLDRYVGIQFIQVQNPMLEKVEDLLKSKEIPYTKKPRKKVPGRQPVYSLRTYGRRNLYPLMGRLQPPRLLERLQ